MNKLQKFTVYIFLYIVLFLSLFSHYYFDIQETKYIIDFFVIGSFIYSIIMIGTYIPYKKSIVPFYLGFIFNFLVIMVLLLNNEMLLASLFTMKYILFLNVYRKIMV